MNINIRRAQPKDSGRIIELLVQIAALHHNGRPDVFRPACKKYTPEEFADILCNPDKPVFVAVDETDRVVGYCFCIVMRYSNHHVFYDHVTLYIDDLCVDETLRGSGVGKALFAVVKAYATKIGADNIDLNVWEFNTNAIKFYESCGMTTKSRKMEIII